MTEIEALMVLEEYNLWRRADDDDDNIEQPDPKAIGQAIDVAIECLRKQNPF